MATLTVRYDIPVPRFVYGFVYDGEETERAALKEAMRKAAIKAGMNTETWLQSVVIHAPKVLPNAAPDIQLGVNSAVTAKAEAVGRVLLWVFHNCKTGLCIPGYETIAEEAHCHRDTVAEAIKMLEAAGILTWCNRRDRVRISGSTKVIRASNSYRFVDPGSKSELPSGTSNQDRFSLKRRAPQAHRTEVRPPWGIPDGVYLAEAVT